MRIALASILRYYEKHSGPNLFGSHKTKNKLAERYFIEIKLNIGK